MDKKIITTLRCYFCLTGPMIHALYNKGKRSAVAQLDENDCMQIIQTLRHKSISFVTLSFYYQKAGLNCLMAENCCLPLLDMETIYDICFFAIQINLIS